MKTEVEIGWHGRVEYDTAVRTMEFHRERLISGDSSGSCILLLEHPPVITLGRNANRENLVLPDAELKRRGVAVRQSTRGGDVTYHGPGQLMVYPIVKVNMRISHFLEGLAGVLAAAATSFGAPDAEWRVDPAGLWMGDRKLAACGLHMKNGVCTHGFAFNVATPSEAWNAIVPCGLVGPGPVSLAELLGGAQAAPTVQEFALACVPLLKDWLDASQRGIAFGVGKA